MTSLSSVVRGTPQGQFLSVVMGRWVGLEREPLGSSTSLLSSHWSPGWGGHPSLLGAASEGQRVWGEESGRVQPIPRGNGKLRPWWFPSSIDHLTWKRTFKFQAVFTYVTTGR